MKINWIKFENLNTGLKIEKINFYSDMTLLVGLSGVGKSQILHAVEYSLRLAVDKNIRLLPHEATISFQIDDKNYVWSYTINKSKSDDLTFNDIDDYQFIYEKLSCENELIFERNLNQLTVDGYANLPTPKFNESLIQQYSADQSFAKLSNELKKFYNIETDMEVNGVYAREPFYDLKKKVNNILKQKNKTQFDDPQDLHIFSHLPTVVKLYIIKYYYQDLYIKFFDYVKELFMEIEDIDVKEIPSMDVFMVTIKVYGKELYQHDISNGMLKTIYYFVELVTMPENSIVLIDEFENGLGVNCIDILAEMMLTERNDLQFIITSHHPKIINQISKENWKIIDRDISTVKNYDSNEYGIGNSQHDSYFNLINRWEFEGKI